MSQETYSLRSGPADREADRLKRGHGVLLETTGDLLPPSLKLDYNVPLKVADVGTGTGDWLFQVEQILSSGSILRGFDVSNTQFQHVPEGSVVSLRLHDMLIPFPDSEHAQYDVVHARLLMYAFKSEDWIKVIGNLSMLLKPGGRLFWEDTGYDVWTCVPASIAWTTFILLDQKASLAAGRDLLFANKLGRYFKEAGLSEVIESLHSSFDLDDQGKKRVTALMLRLHEQSSKGAVARGGVVGLRSIEDADRLLDGMRKEVGAGVNIGFCLRRVIGRKL